MDAQSAEIFLSFAQTCTPVWRGGLRQKCLACFINRRPLARSLLLPFYSLITVYSIKKLLTQQRKTIDDVGGNAPLQCRGAKGGGCLSIELESIDCHLHL